VGDERADELESARKTYTQKHKNHLNTSLGPQRDD